MSEKEIIKKIKLLKSIQPEQNVLKNLKRDIYQHVGIENERNKYFEITVRKFFINFSMVLKSYRYISVGVIFVLLLLFFSFMTLASLPNHIHKIILYTKVALAPNQYEKARLALDDVTHTYKKTTSLVQNNLNSLSQELAFTNLEMSSLKLKGERGKYTALQCHTLYQQYLMYLKEENTTISRLNQKQSSSVKSQIIAYKEQAEQKLHMYPRL